jgi:hypothetical protein
VLIWRWPSNSRIRQLEEENARLRQETESLRSPDQRQIGEKQIHVEIPSSKIPACSGILSPEEPDTSVPLLRDQGRNTTSTGLDAGESIAIGFNKSSNAIFHKHYLASSDATAVSQVDVSIKTQLLAEAAKQRRLLLIALILVRTFSFTQSRPTRAYKPPFKQIVFCRYRPGFGHEPPLSLLESPTCYRIYHLSAVIHARHGLPRNIFFSLTFILNIFSCF